jgi:aminoglycoside 3-N-acetyltransferase
LNAAVAAAVAQLVPAGRTPVVVHAGLWPLALACRAEPNLVADAFIDALIARVVERGGTLLMPTETRGYVDGRCDLDAEPSVNGVMSERFRTRPGVRRTCSAFFSFAALGPDADELAALRPADALGDGSTYAWLGERNARFVLLGCNSTSMSFLHRAEWLLRDRIPYRGSKTFSGIVHLAGRDEVLTETLHVRSREPDARNDFTRLHPLYERSALATANFAGVTLYAIDAQPALDILLAALAADPLFVLANPAQFAHAVEIRV